MRVRVLFTLRVCSQAVGDTVVEVRVRAVAQWCVGLEGWLGPRPLVWGEDGVGGSGGEEAGISAVRPAVGGGTRGGGDGAPALPPGLPKYSETGCNYRHLPRPLPPSPPRVTHDPSARRLHH